MAPRPDLRAELRVRPGTRVRLARRDHAATHGWDKPAAEAELARQNVRLASLQDRFWAEAKRSVLVVLQGIDAAGKDGTINKVMEAFNPQGCPVTAFKVPSTEELAHDYLWRVHKAVPRKGEIGIFNRSHYEDVLVVRVHDLVPKTVWGATLRPDQRVRAASDGEWHDHREVLPVDRPRRAARAFPGSLRRSNEALEVLDGRHRGARPLGRLPGGLR